MKLMKDSDMMKNMMNKEFRHFVESQFVLILNLIEMKLMKVSASVRSAGSIARRNGGLLRLDIVLI
jgi:hypothetical protein